VLPGVATVMSMTGAREVVNNIPYLEQSIELFESIMKTVLLMGSKPG
jgi:hypothetical protein